MKGLLIGAVMIGAMLDQLAAQANSPETVVVVPFGFVMPVLVAPNPSRWGDAPFDSRGGRHGDSRFPSWGYACDPFYGCHYGDNYPAQPSVIVAIPQVVTPPPQAPPPPPPIRSEMHEYHWPSSGSPSGAATFSIISKDGQVQSATLVWVQDGSLFYITPAGSQGRMPIDSIDLQATRQGNAGKQLESLPKRL